MVYPVLSFTSGNSAKEILERYEDVVKIPMIRELPEEFRSAINPFTTAQIVLQHGKLPITTRQHGTTRNTTTTRNCQIQHGTTRKLPNADIYSTKLAALDLVRLSLWRGRTLDNDLFPKYYIPQDLCMFTDCFLESGTPYRNLNVRRVAMATLLRIIPKPHN